jgi:uncharacterized protein
MDILINDEIDELVRNSKLVSKYSESIYRESAYEMLNRRLEISTAQKEYPITKYEPPKQEEKSTFEKVLTSSTTKQIGGTLIREITRGIFGVLGLGGTTRKRR